MTFSFLVHTDWVIHYLNGQPAERGRLRAKKKTVADFDLMIGAIALQHSVRLLTNNRRHFEMIEGLQMESVEIPPKKKSRS